MKVFEGRICDLCFRKIALATMWKMDGIRKNIRGMERIANLKMLFLVDCFVRLRTESMREAEIQKGGWSNMGKGYGKSLIRVPYPIHQFYDTILPQSKYWNSSWVWILSSMSHSRILSASWTTVFSWILWLTLVFLQPHGVPFPILHMSAVLLGHRCL